MQANCCFIQITQSKEKQVQTPVWHESASTNRVHPAEALLHRTIKVVRRFFKTKPNLLSTLLSSSEEQVTMIAMLWELPCYCNLGDLCHSAKQHIWALQSPINPNMSKLLSNIWVSTLPNLHPQEKKKKPRVAANFSAGLSKCTSTEAEKLQPV